MKIDSSTFTIVANGFADGPAQALRDFLIKHGAQSLQTITHPLVPEGDNLHEITTYKHNSSNTNSIRMPHKPPLTYVIDPFIPFRISASTAWFGFNNLACIRGLVRRKFGRTEKVYYWAVDFVPQRFGKSIFTKVYDFLDRYVCTHADARIELSQSALEERPKYLNIPKHKLAPSVVVPMGAWLDRTAKVPDSAWSKKKVVYLGHLVERQGVATLIKAVGILVKKDSNIQAEIIGSGPEAEGLRKLVGDLGLERNVKFHGFVKDHKDVETILASATVAAAPYVKDPSSFTQFADPGKLKAYLGAGLPIVLTDVPPNAQELENAGVAEIVDDTPDGVAEGINGFLGNEKAWRRAHTAAKKTAQEFDWEVVLKKSLDQLGLED